MAKLKELTEKLLEKEKESLNHLNGLRKECEEVVRMIGNKSLKIGIWQSTIQGNLLYMNPVACRMLKYENFDEVRGISAMQIWRNPEERKKMLANLKENEYGEIEAEFMAKDGTIVTGLVSIMKSGNFITGVVIKKEEE